MIIFFGSSVKLYIITYFYLVIGCISKNDLFIAFYGEYCIFIS